MKAREGTGNAVGHRTGAYLFIALLLFSSCTRRPHHVTPSFYYWKTAYALSPYEQSRLHAAGCRRLYLRCFDVGINQLTGQPGPQGTVRLQQPLDTTFRYVPVVFITREVLSHIAPAAVGPLATNISTLLDGICTQSRWQPDEIQIDCDWTVRAKETYFALLQALRRQSFFRGKQLSCTIRLHQVKYKRACGIPPVDRGLVMCYNVGNLQQPGPHNSILDTRLAKDYLAHLDSYPLPADIALPLFRWCVQFRAGKLRGILRDVPPEAVRVSPLFQSVQEYIYRCRKDTTWMGYPFREGDELRLETPSLPDIQSIAVYTAARVRNDSLRVILFHADSLTLSKYSPDDLQALYGAYR